MKLSERQKRLLTQWIDGQPVSPEIRKLIDEHPELERDIESIRNLTAEIAKQLPAGVEPPSPDFFNHQIQERIRSMELEKWRSTSIWPRFAAALKKPAAIGSLALAGVAIAGIFALGPLHTSSGSGSQVISTYTPDSHVRARSFYNEEASATVIVLEGMPDMAPSRDVAGFNDQEPRQTRFSKSLAALSQNHAW